MHPRNSIIGGAGRELMRAYAENSSHLLTFTELRITHVILQNGDDGILSETLRRCTNLKKIDVLNSNVTDEQIVPMIEAIRGHNS